MGFGSYFLRRFAYLLVVLFLILSLNFVMFRMVPGDPVSANLNPRLSPKARQAAITKMGLDQPLYKQYFTYLRDLMRFDLGTSFRTHNPVIKDIAQRMPNTLYLLGSSMFLAILIGILLGIYSAAKQGSLADTLVIGGGLAANALPGFFLQLLMLLALGYYLPLFPLNGTMSAPPPTGFWPVLVDRLHHLILPMSSLVIISVGSWALYTRSMMIEILSQDYITTARAKGLSRIRILVGHAFRSGLPPIVTLIFLSLPGLVSGAVITEGIFSWYGIGDYMLSAVTSLDYPAAQGSFYIIALSVLVSNFLADLVYGLVDPRIKVGGGEAQ